MLRDVLWCVSNLLGGSGGMLPQKFWTFRPSENDSEAFWVLSNAPIWCSNPPICTLGLKLWSLTSCKWERSETWWPLARSLAIKGLSMGIGHACDFAYQALSLFSVQHWKSWEWPGLRGYWQSHSSTAILIMTIIISISSPRPLAKITHRCPPRRHIMWSKQPHEQIRQLLRS